MGSHPRESRTQSTWERLPQGKEVEFSTLISFETHISLLRKLSGLAKEEEIDVQFKIILGDRLTGTPCGILSSYPKP